MMDKATRKAVAQLITALETHEQTLAELVVDAQDRAEEQGVFSAGFFTGDNDDIPICVPEDADPLLDGARTGVQESLDELREWQKHNGSWDPVEDIEYLRKPNVGECPSCGEIALTEGDKVEADNGTTFTEYTCTNCHHYQTM